ncbi:hypothetical protein JCM21900_006635 [Sporobolomyces salmonicolor]
MADPSMSAGASHPHTDPSAVLPPSLASPSSVPPPRSPSSRPAASSSSSAAYPPIEPSGALFIAYQLRGKTVVLIGGGAVGASRLYHLLCAQPHKVVLIAPEAGLSAETRHRLTEDADGRRPVVEWHDREYAGEADLDGADVVLTAIDAPGLSSAICAACRARRIPVNVADVPRECDFYFGSVLRRGALSVLVSTNGKGPRLAARIRKRLERALPDGVGRAIENVGKLRQGLRRIENGGATAVIARRMDWMVRVCDRWSLAQFGEMDDRMRAEVLEGWDRDEARGYWDVNRAKWGGFARLASWASRCGVGGCPVNRGDPDGHAARCPFVVGSTGFVLGAAVAVAVGRVLASRR